MTITCGNLYLGLEKFEIRMSEMQNMISKALENEKQENGGFSQKLMIQEQIKNRLQRKVNSRK